MFQHSPYCRFFPSMKGKQNIQKFCKITLETYQRVMPADPKNSPGAYHYDPQFIKESLTHTRKSQTNPPLTIFLNIFKTCPRFQVDNPRV